MQRKKRSEKNISIIFLFLFSYMEISTEWYFQENKFQSGKPSHFPVHFSLIMAYDTTFTPFSHSTSAAAA